MRAALSIFSTVWTENQGLDRLSYALNAVLWQILKRIRGSFLKTLPSGATLKVYPNSVYSGIFYSKWFERREILFIRKHAVLAGTFVDVGANVGLYSAYLFDKFDRFILFEPSPSTFRTLTENCALNPGTDCRPLNLAVADAPGMLDFIDLGGLSSTSRVPGRNEIDEANASVFVTTLDAEIHLEDGPIVLKVDVEGLEERVFQGAVRLFADRQVRLLIFERLERTNLERVEALLYGFGYRLFVLTADGRVSYERALIEKPEINLFAVPPDILMQ